MAVQKAFNIYLSPPHMSGAELPLVQDAFESNWIAPLGPHVDAFEQELMTYTGAASCAALNSGTSALHLALIMAGVGAGDIVICPTLTFSASVNPILYQGATPVFIDCVADTWNMDAALCEQAISDLIAKGRKPKAMIVVHLYGMPADMQAFERIARTYSITLIEDAAESLGATYHQQHTGTFGRFGILSFNGNKVITTSGGGALLCADTKDAEQARFLATQARDAAPHYEHSQIGFNYRLSNVCAAIGRGQMTVLKDRVEKRRANWHTYHEALGAIPGIFFTQEPAHTLSSRWLTTITIDPKVCGTDREQLRLKLLEHRIESRPVWKPMHLQPIFSAYPTYSKGVAEQAFTNGLCLPSGSSLQDADLRLIIDLLLESLP